MCVVMLQSVPASQEAPPPSSGDSAAAGGGGGGGESASRAQRERERLREMEKRKRMMVSIPHNISPTNHVLLIISPYASFSPDYLPYSSSSIK